MSDSGISEGEKLGMSKGKKWGIGIGVGFVVLVIIVIFVLVVLWFTVWSKPAALTPAEIKANYLAAHPDIKTTFTDAKAKAAAAAKANYLAAHPDAKAAAIAAVKAAAAAKIPDCIYNKITDKTLPGFDIPVSVFDNTIPISLTDCQKACTDNKCQWLTYDRNGQKCNLKTAPAGSTPDYTTMFNNPDPAKGCATFSSINDSNIFFNDAINNKNQHNSTDTIADCHTWCTTDKCDVSVYDGKNKICYTYVAAPAEGTDIYAPAQ